jgi:uncharacterized protein YkwD
MVSTKPNQSYPLIAILEQFSQDMGHKPIAIMILPLALAGILLLAALTAIPSNNHTFAQQSNNTPNAAASQSNNTGNAAASQSNNSGNTQQQSSSNGNAQESNSNMTGAPPIAVDNRTLAGPPPGIAQESNNTGNAVASQESNNTENTQAAAPSNSTAAAPSNSTATAPSNSTAAAPSNSTAAAPDLINSILAVHNRERAAVGVPALVWSDSLAASAKAWAEHLATTGEFNHDVSLFSGPRPEGENLASFDASKGVQGVSAPHDGQMLWVDEKSKYHGETMNANNVLEFGHYTQMVWRDTKEVGCGIANDPVNGGILVCRYSPAGNVGGQNPY